MVMRILLTAIGLLVVIGALVGTKVAQFRSMGAMAAGARPPPAAVAAKPVDEQSWHTTFDAVGTVVPVHGVVLHAEVAGTIRRIHFDSGAAVRAGAVLVELDSSTEQAQLKSALASAELARLTLQRQRALRGDNAVSQADLENADAHAKQADAEVARLRAEIAKRTIRAPFTGNLGIWQINLGQFLQAGQEVTSVQALDPVYVDFTLPQQRLSELSQGLAVRVTTDAYPGNTFEGTVSAINPGLEASTRSVQLRATLRNPEKLLRPGMFAQVEVVLPKARQVLAIPNTAVIYAPYGNSVFVVEPGKGSERIARQRFVRLGERRGDYVAVTDGLKAGDVVVITGAFKLRNDTPVTIDNSLVPKTSLEPSPQDN